LHGGKRELKAAAQCAFDTLEEEKFTSDAFLEDGQIDATNRAINEELRLAKAERRLSMAELEDEEFLIGSA